jgi:hypothetical protein
MMIKIISLRLRRCAHSAEAEVQSVARGSKEMKPITPGYA